MSKELDGTVARGSAPHVSPTWLAKVKERLETLGWSNRTLAKEIRRSPPTIGRMFEGKASHRVIADVARVLQLTDPATLTGSDNFAEWIDLGKRMRERSPRKFESVANMMRTWVTAQEANDAMENALLGKTPDSSDD